MGGIIRSITGGESSSEKRARREKRAQAAFEAEQARKKTALLASEAEAEREKAKRKMKRTGARATLLTSPLGLSDSNLSDKLG
jgi:hypothetical protein